jgi:hypothetical protein
VNAVRLLFINCLAVGFKGSHTAAARAPQQSRVARAVTERAKIAQAKKKGGNRFCVIITLNFKNAFNSAAWGAIAQALYRLGISERLFRLLGDYFRNRVLIYCTEAGQERMKVSSGVP